MKHNKMAQSIVDLNENEDRFLEPELKPEYIEKLEKIRKSKYIKYNSIEELRKTTS